MKILVTGGAGFLGSHLVEALHNRGHQVSALDNLSTGSLSNLNHLIGKPNFEFIFHDVVNPFDYEVDAIFNFACPASPIQYQINPLQTLLTNVLGTVNGLQLALKHSAIFIQASTSEVYGDPKISPQTENYFGNVNPIGPRACYDEGKRSAETAIFDFVRLHSLDARVIRIFNTYGPRMAHNDGRVVSNFVVAALSNQDITIYGDGSQSRSFCYVDDTIDAFLRILSLEKAPKGPINIGNPNEISMNELAETVISLTGSESKRVNLSLPEDDPKMRCPDITMAGKLLAWEPKTTLLNGLKETILYFKNN